MEGCEPSEPRNSPKSSPEACWLGWAIKYEGESQIRLLVSHTPGQNALSCLDVEAFSLAVGSDPSLVWVKKEKKTDCDMKCERRRRKRGMEGIRWGREEGVRERMKNECKCCCCCCCCDGGREVGDIRVERRANWPFQSWSSLIAL